MKNKKISLAIIVTLMTWQSLWGQFPAPKSNLQAPNVATLNTFGAIPVGHYTGTPDIGIPLYKLETQGISIPIELKYHTGNVKPNTHPGIVGLGWNLLCGGSITRIQHDLNDEYKCQDGAANYSWGYLHQNYASSINTNQDIYLWAGQKIYPGTMLDLSPDQFVFNFLGYSGSFYLNSAKQWKVASATAFKVEHEIIKSNQTRPKVAVGSWQAAVETFHKFILTAPDGTKFIFGGIEAIDYSVNYEKPFINGEVWYEYLFPPVATTWHLSKIITPQGFEIEFTYQELSPVIEGNMVFYTQSNLYFSSNGPLANYQLIMPVYLKSIKYNNQEVINFYYKVSTEKEHLAVLPWVHWDYDGVVPFDLTKHYNDRYIGSYSEIKWQQLSDIEINNEVKYKFHYTKSKQERLKLLKLEKLSMPTNAQITEIYQFKYNSNKLPDYLSGHFDYLGFYNGKDFSNSFSGSFPFSVDLEEKSQEYIAAREPDITGTYLFSEILESITYPTGGSSVFEYEPHFARATVTTTRTNINPEADMYPGGMRIKKITNYTAENEFANAKGYYYLNSFSLPTPNDGIGGIPSGVLSFTPQYYWELYLSDNCGYPENHYLNVKILTSHSTNQAWYNSEGNYIGYSTVVETNEDETGNIKGHTEYTFTNFHQDIWGNSHYDTPPLIYQPNNPDQISHYTPFSSKSMERGKITSEKVYDANGQLKRTVYYKYNRTVSDTIKSIKLMVTPALDYINNIHGRFGLGGICNIYNYSYLLSEKRTIIDGVETKINYAYNLYNQLIATATTNSDGKTLGTRFDYAWETYPELGMLNRHILSPVALQTDIVTNPASAINNYVVNMLKNEYRIENNFPVLSKVSTGINVSTLETEVNYSKYDSKGNLLQKIGRDNIPVTYLWSYNQQYPIAEITGATYAEITGKIPEANLNTIAARNEPTASDLTIINNLRTQLPNALITTYTYKPLVGMLTMTDPYGITTYYECDSPGRLKNVRTGAKNTPAGNETQRNVESYEYHYKTGN